MSSFCRDKNGLCGGTWGPRSHFHSIKTPGFTTKFYCLSPFVLLAMDPKKHAVMFDTLQDWCRELERTKGNMKYKAVSVNEGYKVCER